jgi:hypothetical protein
VTISQISFLSLPEQIVFSRRAPRIHREMTGCFRVIVVLLITFTHIVIGTWIITEPHTVGHAI